MINNSEVLTTERPSKNCITQYSLHSVLGRLPLPCYHDLIPSMPACWDYYKSIWCMYGFHFHELLTLTTYDI